MDQDMQEKMQKMQRMNRALGRLSMIGQFGVSLVVPLVLILYLCYLGVSRLGLGLWIYIPGLILGLGTSFMTAYRLYLTITQRDRREKESGRPGGFRSSRHL